MTYNLNTGQHDKKKRTSTFEALKKLFIILSDERKTLVKALAAIIINALLTLIAPYIIAHTIDNYIETKQYNGVILFSGILLGMYLMLLLTGYLQTKLMGTVGQRVLYKLRKDVFSKLQDLPIAFFNENKAGDLISRINNDTDKLNQFLSQSLVQFINSIFIMVGAGVFLLSINLPLGAAALSPVIILILFTRVVTPWVKKLNAVNMASTGNLSSEIQESLANFKVVVAFNRRDYFRKRFDTANKHYYDTAVRAGIANSLFIPVYGFFSNIGQLVVLAFGIYLISVGNFTIGFLIGFLSYINYFYNPLRQLAAVWTNFQIALAGWDRISRILSMENNLVTVKHSKGSSPAAISFKNVSFSYTSDKEVIHKADFDLEIGKTYAFVGPTGGGKTTTASLISRLYDPVKGTVELFGKDLKAYSPQERSEKIGFILQDPILFSGTIKENIFYGNDFYDDYSNEQLTEVINNAGLKDLLKRFEKGLDTEVENGGDSISLGQKQIIAFMRAVLRKPEILILDEATANIDTVTEQQLENILQQLPKKTTRIIIAHRLNTIENANVIFFVNDTRIERAGSMEDAVKLLMHHKHDS